MIEIEDFPVKNISGAKRANLAYSYCGENIPYKFKSEGVNND